MRFLVIAAAVAAFAAPAAAYERLLCISSGAAGFERRGPDWVARTSDTRRVLMIQPEVGAGEGGRISVTDIRTGDLIVLCDQTSIPREGMKCGNTFGFHGGSMEFIFMDIAPFLAREYASIEVGHCTPVE